MNVSTMICWIDNVHSFDRCHLLKCKNKNSLRFFLFSFNVICEGDSGVKSRRRAHQIGNNNGLLSGGNFLGCGRFNIWTVPERLLRSQKHPECVEGKHSSEAIVIIIICPFSWFIIILVGARVVTGFEIERLCVIETWTKSSICDYSRYRATHWNANHKCYVTVCDWRRPSDQIKVS